MMLEFRFAAKEVARDTRLLGGAQILFQIVNVQYLRRVEVQSFQDLFKDEQLRLQRP
jgi:hypothetical protein